MERRLHHTHLRMFEALIKCVLAIAVMQTAASCRRQSVSPETSSSEGAVTSAVGTALPQTQTASSAETGGPADDTRSVGAPSGNAHVDEAEKPRERPMRAREPQQWERVVRAWKDRMAAQRQLSEPRKAPPPATAADKGTEREEEVKPVAPAPRPEVKDVAAAVKYWRETGDRDAALVQVKRLSDSGDAAGILKDVMQVMDSGERELKLFAAAGLASIGTPAAAKKLAELIVNTPEGDLKTDLVEMTAGLSNRESAPFLFEIIRVSGDDDLLQAAQRGLANMTDRSTFGAVISRYMESQDEAEKDNLLGAIRHIADPDAVGYMAEIVSLPDTNYGDPLALAVVDTLGIIGSPQAVTTLVGLMNKIPDGELSLELMDAMGRVMNPDSLGLLLAVAKGEQSACVSARLAAMQALPHYGRSYVTPALSVIAQGDSNDEIKSAAKAALAVLDAKKK